MSSIMVLDLKPGLCAPCEQGCFSNAQETLDLIRVKNNSKLLSADAFPLSHQSVMAGTSIGL